MHIRSLRVFCDVVERHSFSQAARDNGMTQGGASQTVQHLEDFLQVRLLDRSKRPFLITPEGKVFHEGCKKLLRGFDTLTEEVRSIGNEINGEATIASIYSIGISYLPQLQRRFQTEHPRAVTRTQFGHPDEVYRLVEEGTADFGLVSYPESSKTIIATRWREERMLLVGAHNHPLSRAREISAEELASVPLVAFSPKLRIRHEIDRFLRQLGIDFTIAAELDNIDSVKHAMEAHSAVAFLPEPTVRDEIESGHVFVLPIPWLNLTRPLGLIQRRDVSLGRTARGVIELIMAESNHQ